MLASDDPREICFQDGVRKVTFDDREFVLCSLNDSYKECIIYGSTHRIRLGAPTRELYVDGKWYGCSFGGPPVTVEIGGKKHIVKLEGPPPEVKIGLKRTDLVAGKIYLIIDNSKVVPVFLDAKPQRFDIENKPH
ncbi:polyadenylation and cleavage factor homolog 11-like, partial [Cryptotermes secundus]|uniref:polyadenylation and cleavage factor homolog 11-like n=1 Tax=Cryptotermes secundus TaxID=105785 RepID=UPI001454BFDD